MRIETEIANAVTKTMEENNGQFIPPGIVRNRGIHFAIDNTDFRNDTPNGKSEFHGTGMTAFQRCENERDNLLQIERKSGPLKFSKSSIFETQVCYKPKETTESFPNFSGIKSKDFIELYKETDKGWSFCKSVDQNNILPTWAATNSLMIDETPEITKCRLLPLFPGSPTDWSNLYTALKIVQGITTTVSPNQKTIVSLDLQLYAKCVQLREKQEIKDNFIFRLGELHIVFAALKVIGKYIENSGLDRVFLEAGVYGPTTLAQIMCGKHMKRGMEAYMVLYLALTKLLVESVVNNSLLDAEEVENIKEKISCVTSNDGNAKFQEGFKELLQLISEIRVTDRVKQVEGQLDNQAKMLNNFMKLYEALLLFVRSSRQKSWKLHLQSLDALVKFFFAHDQLNYARLTPFYLADMANLEENDAESWEYLSENFSISKSLIPFTSIGGDHAMEQENKVLKVTGGVTGLTQMPSALTRFCMIAPVMSSLSSKFEELNSLKSSTRKEHYQLTGSTNKRIYDNAAKVEEVLKSFDVSFESNDCVYNVVSKAVLGVDDANEFLNHDNIGQEMYENFLSERLNGDTSIWSKMKKRKLKTFKAQTKQIKSKIGEKVIHIQ